MKRDPKVEKSMQEDTKEDIRSKDKEIKIYIIFMYY